MNPDARRNRLTAWALAFGLFGVGAVAGVAADRLVLAGGPPPRRGPPSPGAIVERLTRELELRPEQAQKVELLVHERWEALATLSARFEPEADAIRRAADDRIRALLDPAQRERFERRVAEREQRRAELRRGVGRAPN